MLEISSIILNFILIFKLVILDMVISVCKCGTKKGIFTILSIFCKVLYLDANKTLTLHCLQCKLLKILLEF